MDASEPTERPDLSELLRGGVRSEDLVRLGEALGLPGDAGEVGLGRAMVRALAEQQVDALALASAHEGDRSMRPDPSRVVDGRASYLMRLTFGAEDRGLDLARLDDTRTLLAVVHAGGLMQRRAAVLRLGELMSEKAERAVQAVETLIHLRRFELAYELSLVCSRLPGGDGRRARAGRREWDRLSAEVERQVLAFWEGERSDEPVGALPGDQRAQLLARTRDLPETLARHLAAVIEDSDGVTSVAGRTALVGALRSAGDRRLVPALRAALAAHEPRLVIAAARALASVDDPRVHPLLRQAYERTTTPEPKLVLAGALGAVGDARGLGYVREALADDALVVPALQALDELGTYDDVQSVTTLLESDNPRVQGAAVRTLARIGDGRALTPLSRLSARGVKSALQAEIEEARRAITARLELLGEEPPEPDEEVASSFDTAKMAAIAKTRDPAWVRLRAEWCLLLGYLWLSIGVSQRAIARFEAAAALRPAWVTPVISAAMANARRRRPAQALSGFRRALEIDRRRIEDDPAVVRTLAQAFLRRAEAVEVDGRDDIAYGLLEEVLALDLRKAPSGLRVVSSPARTRRTSAASASTWSRASTASWSRCGCRPRASWGGRAPAARTGACTRTRRSRSCRASRRRAPRSRRRSAPRASCPTSRGPRPPTCGWWWTPTSRSARTRLR
jgi:tetratricopeptide (TPR) repeat protein